MRHRWPEDTRFTRLVLEVEDNVCAVCGGVLHICDHRRHRIFTLQGPVEMVCKLAHCADRHCAAHAKTRSPYAETTLTLPWWLIGWGVFCWVGPRRLRPPLVRAADPQRTGRHLSDSAVGRCHRGCCTSLSNHARGPAGRPPGVGGGVSECRRLGLEHRWPAAGERP